MSDTQSGNGRDVLILHEAEIRKALDMPLCIDAVEQAFASYSSGNAELPAVVHLDIPEHGGEIHIKTGYIHGEPIYATKFASGFTGTGRADGRSDVTSINDGLVLVFDATSGAPRAFLFDNGCITDIRTGAAGGVAVRHLAPERPLRVAMIGTGTQAGEQLRAITCVRDIIDVRLWSRSPGRALGRAADLAREFDAVSAVDTVRAAVEDADLVVTVTPNREPLVWAEWLADGATVVAVGSDGPGKQELDPQILADADLVVADSRAQCAERGELQHALAAELVSDLREVTELGEVVAGTRAGRTSDGQLIVCDLTGVGVQDVAAAGVVLERGAASAQRLTL